MLKRFFRTLWRAITDLPFVLILIVVMMVTIIGVPFPPQFPVLTVADFQLASFPTGLAFYQEGVSSVFYSFSPIDDFLTDTSGQKITLSNYDSASNAENTAFNQPTLWQKPALFTQHFLGQSIIRYTPLKPNIGVTYKAQRQGNSIVLSRQLRLPAGKDFASSTMTLKVTPDDVVMNSAGTVFSEAQPQYLASVSPILGIDLSPVQIASESSQSLIPITYQTIYLMHPNLTGFLSIKLGENQTAVFDRQNLLLMITEPISTSSDLIESTVFIEPVARYPKL